LEALLTVESEDKMALLGEIVCAAYQAGFRQELIR
jgi:hypothetical protein